MTEPLVQPGREDSWEIVSWKRVLESAICLRRYVMRIATFIRVMIVVNSSCEAIPIYDSELDF